MTVAAIDILATSVVRLSVKEVSLIAEQFELREFLRVQFREISVCLRFEHFSFSKIHVPCRASSTIDAKLFDADYHCIHYQAAPSWIASNRRRTNAIQSSGKSIAGYQRNDKIISKRFDLQVLVEHLQGEWFPINRVNFPFV